MKTPNANTRVTLAVIGAPHGVRGLVWLNMHTSQPDALGDYSPFDCELGDDALVLHLEELQRRGGRYVARFRESANRDDAEGLRGAQLTAAVEQLPVLPSGEYYWFQLQGCRVESAGGDYLGEVMEMTSTGREDLMRVRSDDWSGLIPFAKERVVLSVDIDARLIRVDWDRDWT